MKRNKIKMTPNTSKHKKKVIFKIFYRFLYFLIDLIE